jgi:KDO2-lipid IV(A) lauroyltransferase
LRYRLEYILFRLIAGLAGALPLETASRISGAAWRLIAPLLKRHRRAMTHLALAFPETSEAELQIIARDMWETLGRVFAESFHLDELAASDRITIENEAELREMLSQTNGFVACAAHQGNWEIAVVGLARMGYRTAGIYQRIKNPYVDEMARRVRAPLYPGGLYPKQPATALTVLRYVKSGGVLSIMADLRETRGVKVPFFGRPAPSTPFPALIAVSQNKPLFAAQVIRDPGVRFRISMRPVEVPRTGDREADIAGATANLQAMFEDSIRRHPDQWMWGHRRWG